MNHSQTTTLQELVFFDAQWYMNEYPDIKKIKINPLNHFLDYGWKENRNPSKFFNTGNYLKKYPELLLIDMNPFEHIAFSYNGASFSDIQFPPSYIELNQEFKPLQLDKKYKRIAIVASFIHDGIIPKHLLLFLGKLKKVTDGIIFIGDNPILPSEVKKLSNLVSYASFIRHEEYDFGSYKRGFQYLKEKIDIEMLDELILCNDSCIGPIFPFDNLFSEMSQRKVDFWGLTSNIEYCKHVQTYFLVFTSKVINSDIFNNFLRNVKKEESRTDVIIKYELPFTKILEDNGFSCDSYIPYPDQKEYDANNFKRKNLTLTPVYLLERKCPLIKLKHFIDANLNCNGIENTVAFIEKVNPTIAGVIKDFIVEMANKNKPDVVVDTNGKIEKLLPYLKLNEEIEFFISQSKKPNIFRESAIMHKYLDGLNGIEIGAASHNPFGLDKTGGYANVDYKANHGNLWQAGSLLEPAKVNIVASGDELPFGDETLDYVISSHALEHFFDPIKTIEEWLRVVKKNGYVAMIIPHKERTFDRLRPLTSPHELIARNKNIFTAEKYYYRTDVEASDHLTLPADFLQIFEDGQEKPSIYAPIHQDVDIAHLHLSVWDTKTFIELCTKMQWTLVEAQDYDDKVGNGFLIILQKK